MAKFATTLGLTALLCSGTAVAQVSVIGGAPGPSPLGMTSSLGLGPAARDLVEDQGRGGAEDEKVVPLDRRSDERRTAAEWLKPGKLAAAGPAEFMARIEDSLDDPAYKDLASSIATGLAFCIAEAPEQPEAFERADRLPLARARREAKAWSQASTRDFVRHVLESWVLAQHVYWSVGRGLADARARGKTILRLRVALEDGGWNLTSASARVSPPVPTPDRLKTALNLAKECELLPA